MKADEPRGFVPKAEREDINVSPAHPMREAALLVGGVLGVSLGLFIVLALVVDFMAPLVPPSLETLSLGWWGRSSVAAMDDEERAQAMQVKPVLDLLLAHWTDRPYDVRLAVQTSPDVNAFALPGGTILITTGLLEAVGSEAELAFVLGHELGHFAHRDHMRGLGRGVALATFQVAMASVGIGRPVTNLANHLDHAASRRFDRNHESAADEFGVDLLYTCYGNTDGAGAFMRTLAEHESDSAGGLGYLSTHPDIGDRLALIRSRSPHTSP